jgi:Zn-dependent protease/CBS domain-containing protein
VVRIWRDDPRTQGRRMQSSFTLGRISGIEIGIHYTWLLALGLITWSVANGDLPQRYPAIDDTTRWIIALAAALLLFVSVLIHELSHSLVAQARGLQVHSITLFILGGVSNIVGEARKPRDEFLVAAVGPLSSLMLAGLFGLLTQLSFLGHGPAFAILEYLAVMNFGLGVFNLVPGFPLDGGRVLRSLIWAVSGSLRTATHWSSLVGQLVGWALIGYGVLRAFQGDVFGGVWIGLIGWFLNNAAESTRQQADTSAAFRGVRVRDLMQTTPPSALPSMPVQEMVYDYAVRQGIRCLPVVDADGRLLGIVSLSDVRETPQERWRDLTVSEVMTRTPLQVASPAQNAADALRVMAQHDLHQLPVVDDGRLVGLISRSHILRFLQLRDELQLRDRDARAPQAPRA